MKKEYIITSDELFENYGFDLGDYALDTTFVPMIINTALGKAITRILDLNDDLRFEKNIEKALDEEPQLVPAFKKLQFQVIYNLVFLGDNNPIDMSVDAIICSDLRLCKINGWQKRVFVR